MNVRLHEIPDGETTMTCTNLIETLNFLIKKQQLQLH